MARIFISYRRDDSQPLAGRLFDRFSQRLGKENVFRDIDTIDPGAEFAKVIAERIDACDALIAVIGKSWLGARLYRPDDLVAAEISQALSKGKLVIPALIEDTPIPARDALPSQLKALADRNAIRIRDDHFAEDVDRIIDAVEKKNGCHWLCWVAATLAAAGVAAVVALFWPPGRDGLAPVVIKDGKEMLLVPAGAFEMGTDSIEEQDYKPRHRVQLDPFYMDKYEVTNEEYELFVAQQPRRKPSTRPVECPQGANNPVCGVSWPDAKAYCEWMGKQLPTEAQWEKAARGTDGRSYPWGNEPVDGKRANYCDANCDSTLVKDFEHDDRYRYAAPVDSYDAGKSPYGIYNLAGNVWEWVQDWYDPNFYRYSPSDNHVNLNQGDSKGRVVRGGSWNESPAYLRAYYRTWRTPEHPTDYVGFRCVFVPTPGS